MRFWYLALASALTLFSTSARADDAAADAMVDGGTGGPGVDSGAVDAGDDASDAATTGIIDTSTGGTTCSIGLAASRHDVDAPAVVVVALASVALRRRARERRLHLARRRHSC